MELYSVSGYQNRYYVKNQDKLINRADNTNVNPYAYRDYKYIYKNSIYDFQHKTGFNPDKLIEFAEHPHRLQHQASTVKLGIDDYRDYEHIDKIHNHKDGAKQNTHGSSKVDGIKFINY